MGGSSILILEDEPIVRSLYGRILAPMGYRPVFASTLREGLELLSGLAGLDLLISDICLPDGEGTTLIGHVREKFPCAKVLVITGLPPGELDGGVVEKLGLAGSDIVFKPVSVDRFEAEVRRRLPDLGRSI